MKIMASDNQRNMKVDVLYPYIYQTTTHEGFVPIGSVYSSIYGAIMTIWENNGQYYAWNYTVETDPIRDRRPWCISDVKARQDWFVAHIESQINPYENNLKLEIDWEEKCL